MFYGGICHTYKWDRKNLVYLKHTKPDHHPKQLLEVQCSSRKNIQWLEFTIVVEFINKQEGGHGPMVTSYSFTVSFTQFQVTLAPSPYILCHHLSKIAAQLWLIFALMAIGGRVTKSEIAFCSPIGPSVAV